jgi:Domain of unknown function (DUF4386)
MERDCMTQATSSTERAKVARLAGALYITQMALGVFGESFVRGSLVVAGDATRTAQNIVASEGLFRLGIVTDLLTYAGVIVLTWALFVLLAPVNRNLALLAAFFRIAENALLCVVTVNSAMVLALLTDPSVLQVFDAAQLHALARLFIRVQGSGMNIGFILLGIGSSIFAWLLFRSRYVPRVVAAWGIFASLLLAGSSMAAIGFPALRPYQLALMMPMGLYEVGLGAWLLIRGANLEPPLAVAAA